MTSPVLLGTLPPYPRGGGGGLGSVSRGPEGTPSGSGDDESFEEDEVPQETPVTQLAPPRDGDGCWYVVGQDPILTFVEDIYYEYDGYCGEFVEYLTPNLEPLRLCELFGRPCKECLLTGTVCAIPS